MEEIASVYARSLFEVAQEQGKLDDVRDQLGEFADALDGNQRAAGVLLLALLLHAGEEGGARRRRSRGAEPILDNFLELLIEKHRMPAVFRVRRELRPSCGSSENKLLPVEITSAIELDKSTVKQIGDRIGEQTGQKIELSASASSPTSSAASSSGSATRSSTRRSARVSNNFANRSRKGLRYDHLADQARRDHLHPQEPHRGPRRGAGRPDRGRHRPVGRPTASRASTASRTARRSRCSSCPTT